MEKHNIELPSDLAAAQNQITRWRAEHKPRTRFPEQLWQLAAELSRKYGHNQVCKALKLDYYSLKKRLEPGSVKPKRRTAPAFFELLPEKPSSARCSIECENSSGNRIRIHLDGSNLSELRIFCAELWRELR